MNRPADQTLLSNRTRWAIVWGLLLASACGARTALDEGEDSVFRPVDAGAGGQPGGGAGAGAAGGGQGGAGQQQGGAGSGQGGAGKGGQAGAGQDGGVDADADASVDVIVTDTGCKSDQACDDKIDCTADECDPGLGVCTHTPRDVLCDDKFYCNGAERCDPGLGCVAGAQVDCNDGVGCTVDACNEKTEGCDHEPDDKLCPLSHKCGPTEGCYALAYAHSQDTLYEIRLPSGKVTEIGPIGASQMTDIALAQDKKLYGLGFNALYELDTKSGEASFVGPMDGAGAVALDAAPDGQFYAGGDATVWVLDVASAQLKPVASYPQGLQASGDLAFLQGRLLATARPDGQGQGGIDSLIEIDLGTGASKVLGQTGFSCIWGLAAFGETLYGLTCNGQVLSVDSSTGASQVLSAGGPDFWGASAR